MTPILELRKMGWLSVLRWLVVAGWAFVYIPLCLRSFLGEGAGSLGAIIAFILITGGPLGIMIAGALLADRRPRPWVAHGAVVLLLILLFVVLAQLVPSPSTNRDLVLPAALLAAFVGLMLASRTHKTSTAGAA